MGVQNAQVWQGTIVTSVRGRIFPTDLPLLFHLSCLVRAFHGRGDFLA